MRLRDIVEQVQHQEMAHINDQLAAIRLQEQRMTIVHRLHLEELRHLYIDTLPQNESSPENLAAGNTGSPGSPEDGHPDSQGNAAVMGNHESDCDSEMSFSHLTTSLLPPPQRDPVTGEMPDRKVFLAFRIDWKLIPFCFQALVGCACYSTKVFLRQVLFLESMAFGFEVSSSHILIILLNY